MSVEIKPVQTKKDLMKFIKMQWKIYEGDPYWVPPLIMDRKKILDREHHPFYKHAEMEMFLAYRNGEIVGRIAAIKNDLHNQVHNDKVGFFGFFESINDQEVANALFDSAAKWLKSKGLTHMRGPANPSSNDEYGMLIEGFNDSPRFLMTYNPPYYLDLCENYGLKKIKDLYAYKLEYDKITKVKKIEEVQDVVRRRYNLKLTSLNMKDLDNELKKVKYVYNKAWEPNWGFVPMTDEEIDAMAKDLKLLVDPELVMFGEINGEVVGFTLTMPDYNQIFKKLNGRLFPFGFIRLFTERKKITWARILTLGIIPKYQKKGIDAVFYYEIIHRAAKRGIYLGEASWVLEDNEMMNRAALMMQGELYKKYRIYEKEI
jgi:GNAT superfamily N-acetyltransferase